MALIPYWQQFVTEYHADKIYWYFPKGGTCDTEEFRKKFRIFRTFEGENWTPILQGKYLQALNGAKLSGGTSLALARLLKRDFENLGLCAVVEGMPIRITPAGEAYLKETGRSKILDAHVWRYQMPNPLNDGAPSKGISLFPHVVVVELLLSCGNRITNEEFELFVSRMKNGAELGKCRLRIGAWRQLSQGERDEVLNALKGPSYKTVHDGSGFAMAFHRCDLLLEDRTDRLSVAKGNANALKEALALRKGSQVPIEFKNEPDTAIFYGDPEKLPTDADALDYYVDISDVPRAVAAFKKLPKELRGGKTVKEFEQDQIRERELEEFLEKHPAKIEVGLTNMRRQVSIPPVGRMDLYAKATNGDLVVIELKKGRAADKVFGQLCRYIGCIMSEPDKAGVHVRGYIVGREIDEKLRYAARVVPKGTIGLQTFEFKGEKGKKDWIQISAA